MDAWQQALDEYVDSKADQLIQIRRHLHANPEPSGEELRTSIYVAGRLADKDIQGDIAGSGRGVVAEPRGQSEEPRIALRADIDALRVDDLKDVEYRSRREGIAHACGHDAHTAMLLGACFALQACRDRLPWPVHWRAIFQPAEETSVGARELVNEGAVDNVSTIIGLHVDPQRRLGRIGFRSGTLTAFCTELHVTVKGSGGHAARPHDTVDPIAAAVQFANAVYQFIPRAIDSRDPAVVTFGSIHGGASQNVIPHEVKLAGTARTHSRASRATVERRVSEIASGIAQSSGATIEVAFKPGPDAVINDPRVTGVCKETVRDVLGEEAVEIIDAPSMGGEDFAEYLTYVPGCFFRLGIAPRDEVPFLHSGHFDVDDRALVIGAKVLARCAVALAKRDAA